MEITCDRKNYIVKVDSALCTTANSDEVETLKSQPLQGYIGLQDSHTGEGEWVKFRNIRIRDLDLEPDYVFQGFVDPDIRVRKQAYEAAIQLKENMIPSLCTLLAQDDSLKVRGAKYVLFQILAEASEPDKKAYRSILLNLSRQLQESDSDVVRKYLARLMGIFASRDDIITVLASQLNDPDIHVFEAARDALVRIPGEASTSALIKALESADNANKKISLILGLGAKGDKTARQALEAATQDENERVRAAATEGLQMIDTD
jgi:HEAT repeat protein